MLTARMYMHNLLHCLILGYTNSESQAGVIFYLSILVVFTCLRALMSVWVRTAGMHMHNLLHCDMIACHNAVLQSQIQRVGTSSDETARICKNSDCLKLTADIQTVITLIHYDAAVDFCLRSRAV